MTPDQRVCQLISTARHRAKKKGVAFELRADDISIPEYCPVLGIPLIFSDMKNRHNSPSLDRIKPDLGYVSGNIIVVSWRANDIRRNFRPDELKTVGAFYEKLLSFDAGES